MEAELGLTPTLSENDSIVRSQIFNRAISAIVLTWLLSLPTLFSQGLSAIGLWRDSSDSSLPIPLTQLLDPNVAPWYELSTLPRVGDGLAKRIMDYRDVACAAGAERAFANVADLQNVHGIGPKTAARLAPFLRFEGRCQRVKQAD